MKKVAMIGVGKLGQDCAEVMAQHYDVIGYDVEPRTPEFPMASTIEEAVTDRDIIFIAAPTPHDPKYGGETPTSHLEPKDFDYTIVREILEEVNKYVNQTQLIVLISTVLPGTVRKMLRPAITNARFIYNPYLIAMGTIKWDMVNPEMVIIGTEDGSTTGDAEELIDFYKAFMENEPRYVVGTWDEAESIKIFYNTFISTKLALVNMIQDVAETNGNINVDIVTKALADSKYRIMGPAYMKAGLGDAGACHPRDNIALRNLALDLDLGYDLFDSIMKAREVQAERMALRCLKNGKNVTIVGKAYKPKVPYINGSASMLVGHYITQHGGTVRYYDLNTGDNDLFENVTDVYLIGYWDEFVEQINFPQWTTVIDPWRRLDGKNHTGEIIHYGDSRPKNKFCPVPGTLEIHAEQIFEIYPDLLDVKDEIHVIYAGINYPTTFRLRPFEDIIEEIEAAIKLGKKRFLFDCNAEDYLHDIVKKVQRIANYFEGVIPAYNFAYLCGAAKGSHSYHNYAEEQNINNRISVLCSSFFEYTMKKRSGLFEFAGSYQVALKPKKFLCFNKVPRKHRMKLLDKVLFHGLLDKAYYSFEGHGNWLEPVVSENVYKEIAKNADLFPIRLNITEERTNPVTIEQDDLQYFANSLFSVVTETIFYEDENSPHSVFFSEKIWKPIILSHPFIIVARPYSLAKLKEMGYKTFSPWIDERYDTIEDDEERLEFIVNEIQRLCMLDTEAQLLFMQNIAKVVEHNKTHFFEKNNFAYTLNPLAVLNQDPFYQPDGTNKLKKVEQTQPKQIEKPNIVETNQTELELWDKNLKNIPQPDKHGIYTIQIDPEYDERLFSSKSTKKLSSEVLLTYTITLDGGGVEVSQDIIETVKKIRKDKVTHKTLEWCAGMGAIGFDLLGHELTENVVFQDYLCFAEHDILVNAQKNNLSDKVRFYCSSIVSGLPDHEKFDLVVANPPHVSDYFEFLKNSKMQGSSAEGFLSSSRMCVDHKYSAHKEFFKNIKKYLTEDGDVLLVENTDNHTLKQWAWENGLKHVASYTMPIYERIIKGNMIDARIMHFRIIGSN
jgi:UDPglucose 6-dehydrogenase